MVQEGPGMCNGRQTGLPGWRVRILVRLGLGDKSIHRGAESEYESEPTLLVVRHGVKSSSSEPLRALLRVLGGRCGWQCGGWLGGREKEVGS